MKTISIDAKVRENPGKGSARSTRREGRIPGVLYGQGEMVPLSVDRKDFVTAMHEAHGENVIFDLSVSGKGAVKSIAREVQHDPLTQQTIHIDFQHIDMQKKIHVSVAIHLLGEPEGVRNYGGILEHVTREVEVLCLPADIPSHIDVDVSEMMIGDSVHASDLKTENFEILEEEARVIAQVAAPTVEKVDTSEEEEGEEGAAPAEGAAAPSESDGESS